ncbi:ATP-binding protein [Candidatus Woesearchaeota archaeon]|nr:ATP-binding protein [Candidatus Woesearchaeota archaeon]
MKPETLYYVLFEQQKEFQEENEFVNRELIKKVLSFTQLKLPIIITGVRRTGKSTLLKLIKKELQLREKDCLYINFNDERLIDFSIENFQNVLDFLNEQGYKESCFLFIDEIQEVDKWEKWIDRIKEKHPILITGSNSKLLSKEISTILTGRSINISLYPFSFKEFLDSQNMSLEKWQLDLKLQSVLRTRFSEFLNSGGIPKVVVDNDKRLLQEIYENILYRDIVKRFNKNLEKPIKEVSVYLLSNISKELSVRSLSKIIGIKNLSTVKSILDTFEKAFLFFFINKFDFSIRKQIQNPRKTYCIDNGFVTNIGFRSSENKGRLLENLVFVELKRKNKEIYYFSDKGECDFVVKEGLKIKKAIQVCYDLNEENKDRELNGLVEALKKFSLKEGLILTYDQEDELKIEGKKIKLLPVWKWLLI